MSYQDPNQGYYQGGQPQQSQYGQYGQQAAQGQYERSGSFQGQQPPPQQHQGTGQQQGSGAWHPSDSGQFNGGHYQILHRDTNSVLTVTLSAGGAVKSRSGAMIEMGGNINLEGQNKFTLKKMFTGGTMIENVYTGTGLVTLAPLLLGDIATIHIDGSSNWRVGKHGYLGATSDVVKEAKSQGFKKAFLSGEGMFVYNVSGNGLMWVSSFGAIIRREIAAGETHVVDHAHLVAWNCEYRMEQVGGGFMNTMKSGEGLICRFTGPGTVYLQTRNFEDFSILVADEAGCQRG